MSYILCYLFQVIYYYLFYPITFSINIPIVDSKPVVRMLGISFHDDLLAYLQMSVMIHKSPIELYNIL